MATEQSGGGHSPNHIFSFLRRALEAGERMALVTIVSLTGSSTRALGTHMAIGESGAYAGSLSGGCLEAAIVAEAQSAIAEGADRIVRFGAGSPFIDIKLPCGGGVELLIQPDPSASFILSCTAAIEQREPLKLLLGGERRMRQLSGAREENGWREGAFLVWHAPQLRLIIAGNGEESLALARLASAFGAEVCLLSAERRVLDAAASWSVDTMALTTSASAVLESDAWTAVVLLFHDHDWEPPLLEQALAGPAFFIGAMGSRATHELRLEMLRARKMDEGLLQRIRSPIGLIPSARDPSMLALSAFAQVAAEYRSAAA